MVLDSVKIKDISLKDWAYRIGAFFGVGYVVITYLVSALFSWGVPKAAVNGFADQRQIQSIQSDVSRIESGMSRLQTTVETSLRGMKEEVSAIRKESTSMAQVLAVTAARFEDHVNFTADGATSVRQKASPSTDWRRDTASKASAALPWRAHTVPTKKRVQPPTR